MKDSRDNSSAKQNAPVRYHPREVNAWGIALFAGLIALMLALIFPGIKWVFHSLEAKADQTDSTRDEVMPAIAASRKNFPAPHDQLKAPEDLAVFSAQQQQELNSYGWIDRQAGVVRIPIESAMELISQRASSSATNAATGPSLLDLQQRRPMETNSITGGNQ